MGKRARNRIGPNRDVAIGYCRPDSVDGWFFDSLTTLLLYDREHDQRVEATIGGEGGPRVAATRNEVVRRFLKETTCEWLWWVDCDMVLPPNALDMLLAQADPVEAPIVGGLCFAGGRTTIKPTIYQFRWEEVDGVKQLHSDLALSYPDNACIEVGGTGAACLLTHRSVYEAIEAELPPSPLPWFQDQVISGQDFGEDIVFCLRAKTVGKRTWVHTGVKVGHRKMHVLDQPMFIEFIRRLEATYPDGLPDDTISAERFAEMSRGLMP